MNYLGAFVGAEATIPSKSWGTVTVEAQSFTDAVDGDLVVRIGDPFVQASPLVRIHSECVFAEVFDSALCDCKDQFKMAMERLTREGHGLLFYLRLDGRGAGLAAKVQATALEVAGENTFDSRRLIGVAPEGRSFRAIGDYLRGKNILQIRLLTNNPGKIKDIEDAGIAVAREPLIVENPNDEVSRLLDEKRRMFGHLIPFVSNAHSENAESTV